MIMLAFAQQFVKASREMASADAGATLPPVAPGQPNPTEELQFLRDQLNSLQRDHGKLRQAIFEAAQIQRRLCAPRELTWGEYEVAGEIFPVRHLSGDFFKVTEIGDELGVVLGDIAGKGFTAGIWQAHLMGLIQRAARKHASPADAVAEVNRELCSDENEPPIMALFFARINRNNNLEYCNAGLPAPLLLRGNQPLERLDCGGPMLGATKDGKFETGRVTLNPGDMLVAYSDGVTECRNAADDEFEVERLIAAARAVNDISAGKALFSLLGRVLDFAESSSAEDDLTVLVVRRRGAIAPVQTRARKRDSSASHRRPASVPRPKSPAGGGPVSNS
jgi:serine phosphatase RsbU (regulator of sigma subunit)